MNYPSPEDYQAALQVHDVALLDDELKKGEVLKTPFDIPLPDSGGFALTYKITCKDKNYAVKCFHKFRETLEERYALIEKKIKQIKSQYFVDFVFLKEGIMINSCKYPVVKMEWVNGFSLGQFISENLKKTNTLRGLTNEIINISKILKQKEIAHGDIQPNNIKIIDNNGNDYVKLIDYDGVFTNELVDLGPIERGHPNFQHPERQRFNKYDEKIDRFSFIVIYVALNALIEEPNLWEKTESDSDALLFRKKDYENPECSRTIWELKRHKRLKELIECFENVCKSYYNDVPDLDKFIEMVTEIKAKKMITVTPSEALSRKELFAAFEFLSTEYPILNAKDYNLCFDYVGEVVELVGRIIEIYCGRTKDYRPYVFLHFKPSINEHVSIIIWSECLSQFKTTQFNDYRGQWVSVKGLLQGPYRTFKYSRIYIDLNEPINLRIITESEAKRKLSFCEKLHNI